MSHEKTKLGRPLEHADQETPMDNFNVRLTIWQARMAKKIGSENMSAGIRIAINLAVRLLRERDKTGE